MKSKTIILSSNEKFAHNSPRAILTFIEDNEFIDGKIRLYNLSNLEKGVKIGIYYNQKVISSSLNNNHDCYTFKLNDKINLSQEIFCALVDTENSNKVVLSGGTNPSFDFTYFDDDQNKETEINTETLELATDIEKEDNLILENNTDQDIDELKTNQQENCFNCDCKNCTYKEYFYSKHNEMLEIDMVENKNETTDSIEENIDFSESQNNSQIDNNVVLEENNDISALQNNSQDIDNLEEKNEVTTTQKENYKNNNLKENEIIQNLSNETIQDTQIQNEQSTLEENSSSKETEDFLNSISEQLNEMFLSYPIDEEITKIIPNSKIVKVIDSVDNSSYVVGVLYKNDQIAYIVYGVPSKYNDNPPSELGNNYQWLPLDPEDPLSDGYFLIYQDASSGKLVPVKVE